MRHDRGPTIKCPMCEAAIAAVEAVDGPERGQTMGKAAGKPQTDHRAPGLVFCPDCCLPSLWWNGKRLRRLGPRECCLVAETWGIELDRAQIREIGRKK